MRLLVMEPSPVTAWLIRRLLPPGVAVVRVSEFAEAERVLREDHVDGALFGLTSAQVPWERLRELCEQRVPPVPHLWYYSLRTLPAGEPPSVEAAAEGLPRELVRDLEERLRRFLARVEAGQAPDGEDARPGEIAEGRLQR